MPQPKINWLRAAVILAAGAALVYLFVALGETDIAVFFPSAG